MYVQLNFLNKYIYMYVQLIFQNKYILYVCTTNVSKQIHLICMYD